MNSIFTFKTVLWKNLIEQQLSDLYRICQDALSYNTSRSFTNKNKNLKKL